MKKLLCIIISLLALSAFSFAQTEEVPEVPEVSDPEPASSESSTSSKFKAGVYGNYEQALGDLSNFAFANTGAGVTFEMDLLTKLGIAAHAGYGFNPVKDDRVDSMRNLRLTAGVFTRIPFGTSGFAFQPEADVGLAFNFPKASSDVVEGLDTCYVDQIYQLSLSFRYSNQKLLNGRMELEFTPTYALSPEKNSCIHYAGGRAGVLLKF